MARVITLSEKYPPYHPRVGDRTLFVEKVLSSLKIEVPTTQYWDLLCSLNSSIDEDVLIKFFRSLNAIPQEPKHHTVRGGGRFKVGDKASLRVWSGKPYRSPQIIIAPDLEIKNTWDVEIDECDVWAIGLPGTQIKYLDDKQSADIAKNDGLTEQDLYFWFKPAKKPLIAQVICWSNNVKY